MPVRQIYPKLLIEGNAYVEHPVTWRDYLEMFYMPSAGYFLWFIWALWWMFIIIPLFHTPRSRRWLFAISIVLAYIPWTATRTFCLYEAQHMFVYFMLGIMAYECRPTFLTANQLPVWAIMLIFALAEGIWLSMPDTFGWVRYLLPYLGIYAMMMLCKGISTHASAALRRQLCTVASYSYGIYLFHTTFEGLAKAALQRLMPAAADSGVAFVIIALTVIACGTIMPILLYRYILSKNDMTRLIFGSK